MSPKGKLGKHVTQTFGHPPEYVIVSVKRALNIPKHVLRATHWI